VSPRPCFFFLPGPKKLRFPPSSCQPALALLFPLLTSLIRDGCTRASHHWRFRRCQVSVFFDLSFFFLVLLHCFALFWHRTAPMFNATPTLPELSARRLDPRKRCFEWVFPFFLSRVIRAFQPAPPRRFPPPPPVFPPVFPRRCPPCVGHLFEPSFPFFSAPPRVPCRFPSSTRRAVSFTGSTGSRHDLVLDMVRFCHRPPFDQRPSRRRMVGSGSGWLADSGVGLPPSRTARLQLSWCGPTGARPCLRPHTFRRCHQVFIYDRISPSVRLSGPPVPPPPFLYSFFFCVAVVWPRHCFASSCLAISNLREFLASTPFLDRFCSFCVVSPPRTPMGSPSGLSGRGRGIFDTTGFSAVCSPLPLSFFHDRTPRAALFAAVPYAQAFRPDGPAPPWFSFAPFPASSPRTATPARCRPARAFPPRVADPTTT